MFQVENIGEGGPGSRIGLLGGRYEIGRGGSNKKLQYLDPEREGFRVQNGFRYKIRGKIQVENDRILGNRNIRKQKYYRI